MTRGQSIDPTVVEAIKNLWAQDTSRSAAKVRELYRQRVGYREVPSLRKYQLIIAEARKKSPHPGYPLVEWLPWRNEIESREDAAYLLKLDAISMALSGHHLYQHEAKWGRRLRIALEGLNMWTQYNLVWQYALREVAAYNLRATRAYTADLDGILAYKPWIRENRQAYEDAIAGGVVEFPLAFDPEEVQEHHDTWTGIFEREAPMTPETLATYRELTPYWKGAQRMLEPRPRRSTHVDRDKERFKGWRLDSVLDFWAGEQLRSGEEDRTESGGVHDEGKHQTSEQG